MAYGYLVNVQGNQNAEIDAGKKSAGFLRGYTEILRIFHAAAVILGIFMEKMFHVQTDARNAMGYCGKYAWARLRYRTGCMRKHEGTVSSGKMYGYDEREESVPENVKPPDNSVLSGTKSEIRKKIDGLQAHKAIGMHKAGNKYRDRRLLNRIREVPSSIEKNNKQWMGSCLYQEGISFSDKLWSGRCRVA